MAIVTAPADESLREERKRTGRYAAIGMAIFLTLIACYEAFNKGTWPHAALFGSALIMFTYVLWILYASNRARALMRLRDAPLVDIECNNGIDEQEVKLENLNNIKLTNIEADRSNNEIVEDNIIEEHNRQDRIYAFVNRSYSIA